MTRWIPLLPLLALLPACAGGPLVGPALEMQATRAALQASLNADGEAEPVRGDRLDLDQPRAMVQGPGSRMPIMTDDDLDTKADSDDTPKTEGPTAAATARAALDDPSRAAGRDPELIYTLQSLTREMSEQRMMMMMQMLSGRSDAPVAVDSSGRIVDLSVSVERLQTAQESQEEASTTLLTELQSLRALIDERVPEDTQARLTTLQDTVDNVQPALQEIQAAQEALRQRIEALEALHNADTPVIVAPLLDDDGAGDALPEDDTRGVLIPLSAPPEPTDPEAETEVHTASVTTDDGTTETEPVTETQTQTTLIPARIEAAEPDPSVAEAEADRIASETRSAERLARQERRQAKKRARDERGAIAAERADDREAALAAQYDGDRGGDNTVAIAPVLISQPRGRSSDGCVDTRPGPDGVRFGLDAKATRRLGRLLQLDVPLINPPVPVPLPPIVICDEGAPDA